jgi:hypothetical protein
MAEELLGRPIKWTSVKATLAEHARGHDRARERATDGIPGLFQARSVLPPGNAEVLDEPRRERRRNELAAMPPSVVIALGQCADPKIDNGREVTP